MITELRLANVRNFASDDLQKPNSFSFRDLTLLCGTNSAGKSTVLKSLLFLKQVALRSIPGKPQFAGEYIDLGKYATFVTSGKIAAGLSIGLTVRDVISKALSELILGHDVAEAEDLPYYVECDAEIGYLAGSSQAALTATEDEELDSDPGTRSSERRVYLRRISYKARLEDEDLIQWTVVAKQRESGEAYYETTLPKSLLRDEILSWGFRVPGATALKRSPTLTFECLLRGLRVEFLLIPAKRAKVKQSTLVRAAEVPMPFILADMQQDVARALGIVRHIGPLRAPARRYYVASFDSMSIGDPTGEQVPFVIRDRASQKVLNRTVVGETREEPFAQAIDYWLHYMRTGEASSNHLNSELKVSSREEVLVQLSIRGVSGHISHAMSDSGFGYSQVLPIIAKILLARKATFLVEQPELHLNPALQVRLANFFSCMALSGRQLIVETHSEHLVNMMRVLAAEDQSGKIPEMLRLYYLEATPQSSPRIVDLHVQSDGTVPNWPLEFFGESLDLGSRLLRAQSRFLSESIERR